MSEKEIISDEIGSKYDKYFQNPLREETEIEPEEENQPIRSNIPIQEPERGYTPYSEATREEKIKLYKSLAGISAIGIILAVFAVVFVFMPKKEKEELKPKTRTVTRTVYVPSKETPKKDDTKGKPKEQPKDKDGNPIAEETEEGYEL